MKVKKFIQRLQELSQMAEGDNTILVIQLPYISQTDSEIHNTFELAEPEFAEVIQIDESNFREIENTDSDDDPDNPVRKVIVIK